MTIIFNGDGTIQGLASGGIPDATITNAEIVSLDSTKLTGNIQQAQLATPFNASGTAPLYACRAWVNFNGTGTVAIRASGNVSSITDNSVGDYTVNFTTAMPDANYAVNVTGSNDAFTNYPTPAAATYSTSSLSVRFANNLNQGSADQSTANVSVFR